MKNKVYYSMGDDTYYFVKSVNGRYINCLPSTTITFKSVGGAVIKPLSFLRSWVLADENFKVPGTGIFSLS
jgi:hypothetical protein